MKINAQVTGILAYAEALLGELFFMFASVEGVISVSVDGWPVGPVGRLSIHTAIATLAR